MNSIKVINAPLRVTLSLSSYYKLKKLDILIQSWLMMYCNCSADFCFHPVREYDKTH